MRRESWRWGIDTPAIPKPRKFASANPARQTGVANIPWDPMGEDGGEGKLPGDWEFAFPRGGGCQEPVAKPTGREPRVPASHGPLGGVPWGRRRRRNPAGSAEGRAHTWLLGRIEGKYHCRGGNGRSDFLREGGGHYATNQC